jgi:hypothetical protein
VRLVLEVVSHPLHYTDITEIALESAYLVSRGRTPHNTMHARLYVDVRDNPESPFVKTAPGVCGLQGPAP